MMFNRAMKVLHNGIWMSLSKMLLNVYCSCTKIQKIAQATHYLQQHFSETITVETLANLSGMSLSGFHSHFKKITSLSPLQYQKSLRLMEARRLIAQEEQGITETAYQVGYESPSQFSREYKRYFGHAPKGDIK